MRDYSVFLSFPSRIQVESSQEDIQVTKVGCLEEFWLVHQRQRNSKGSPDVPRDGRVRDLLLVPALSLQTEGREKIADRFSKKGERHSFRSSERQSQHTKINRVASLPRPRSLLQGEGAPRDGFQVL